MKPKSGFRYIISSKSIPRTLNVFFKSFNSKVVKCWIREAENKKMFVGVAKCNTDLDVFDEEFGMKLALSRALDKRTAHYQKKVKHFLEIHSRNTREASDSIMQKLHNNIEKGRLACNEKIQV